MSILLAIIFLIGVYLIGSIPTGYLVTKLIAKKDLRGVGSGNVGATNAARILGFKMGFLVAVIDILKGYLAIILIQLLLPEASIFYVFAAGITVILGHNWSVFLGFNGGKGVATTVGVTMRLFPVSFIIFILIWIILVLLSRYVSIASLIAAVSIPVTTHIYYSSFNYTLFAIFLALFIIITHHENISRLLAGEENRMSWPPNKNKGRD